MAIYTNNDIVYNSIYFKRDIFCNRNENLWARKMNSTHTHKNKENFPSIVRLINYLRRTGREYKKLKEKDTDFEELACPFSICQGLGTLYFTYSLLRRIDPTFHFSEHSY